MRAALILLVILMAPLASAQLPGTDDPVTVTTTTQSLDVRSTQATDFQVTVTRGGQGSGSPLDAFVAADVTIALGDLPPGWTASADPNGFALTPGQSRDVTITVTVAPGTDVGESELTVTAELVARDPLTGAFLGNGEDSVTVSLARADGVTRDVMEAIGFGIWAVIAVAVAALLVAGYLLVDARRSSVRLTALGGEAQILAGTNASIPFLVRNTAGKQERYLLTSSCSDDTWNAEMPIWQVELGPGEEEELLVAVSAPKAAKPGSRTVVRVVAVPDQNPDRVGTLGLSVLVQADEK